jgi:nucleosome binding factor SPN SPT16 subunit
VEIESIIYDPSKLGINVSKEVVESCYTPIIQSGGEYDLRVSAQSNDKVMQFDVIICSLGARYRNYCANIARTYLIDPVKKILDTYTLLMTLTDKCLEQMIVGAELKDVMEGAKNYLNKKAPELIENLPKTLGFAIGLEFRDSTMLLNSSNTTRFEVGMVFNLIVGFQNVLLTDEDKKGASASVKKMNTFSLLIADTVVIQSEGVPDVLTKSTRATSDVTYNLADNDNEGGEDGGADDDLKRGGANFEDGLRRSTRGKEEKEAAERAASHRVQRQRELMASKISLARRKGRGGGPDADDSQAMTGNELQTYSSPEDYPKDTNPYRLKVDLQREAVLVPINGQIVPFHISTIKNVSMPDPDRATHYLRINFYSAGMALGKDAPKNIQHLIAKYGASAFVKELTFRSLDPKNLTGVYRSILDLRKRMRQTEQKKEVERDLVEQDKLIRIKDQRAPQLQDLTMRPQLSGRKSTGALAAHQNGLRFTTTKGEIIDVLYANIKHAFFQPCETATMVLIHFHLKDYILIGKKKQKDLQFYTEVIDASLNLDNQRRSAYDPDELDDEQKEREMKRRLNKTFLEFCKKVEKVAKHYEFNLNYDIPYHDLGFYGTCHREMVYMMPSVSCLVNLTEMPFFVADISEVDHVHFERVTFSTKNFDMVIIFKSYETRAISAIEIKYLEQIQDWLSDVQITYTSGPDSFQWKAVMDTAKEDDRFYYDTHADGTPKAVGWLMLVEGTEDNGSDEDESDEDSEYGAGSAENEEGESEESDEDGSDEDSDESFADEDEESEGDDEEDDEEEKGKVCLPLCCSVYFILICSDSLGKN